MYNIGVYSSNLCIIAVITIQISKMMIDISFIIPSYNGSNVLRNNLPVLFNILNNHNITYEVILVDDGSNDGGKTEIVAKDFNSKYLTYPENRGKGCAVRTGVAEATGKFIVFTDADIPFKEVAFDRMLNTLMENKYDIVIGDRTLESSEYFEVISESRKLGSKVFTFFVTKFITGGLADTQCGFKGFKNSIAKDLFSVSTVDSFAFDVEILYVALKRKYQIKRIPVELRNSEDSSVSLLKHAPRMLMDIFSLKIHHILGHYKKKHE